MIPKEMSDRLRRMADTIDFLMNEHPEAIIHSFGECSVVDNGMRCDEYFYVALQWREEKGDEVVVKHCPEVVMHYRRGCDD